RAGPRRPSAAGWPEVFSGKFVSTLNFRETSQRSHCNRAERRERPLVCAASSCAWQPACTTCAADMELSARHAPRGNYLRYQFDTAAQVLRHCRLVDGRVLLFFPDPYPRLAVRSRVLIE